MAIPLLRCAMIVLTFLFASVHVLIADDNSDIPRFEDRKFDPENITDWEIDVELYHWQNGNRFEQLLALDNDAAHRELVSRMDDNSLRWQLRLLYAAILGVHELSESHQFLLNQLRVTDPKRLAEVFYVLRVIWWGGSYGQPPKHIDMAWAEQAMLDALVDNRSCVPAFTFRTDKRLITVRKLAARFGHFHEILTERRCPQSPAALRKYIELELAAMPPDRDSTIEQNKVLSLLIDSDEQDLEPLLLKVLETTLSARGRNRLWIVREPLQWLVEQRRECAVPIIMKYFDEMDVYAAVVGTKHEPYLKLARDTIGELQHVDKPDASQRRVQAYARLILILGKEPDRTAALIAYVKDSSNLLRTEAVSYLSELRDPRIVPWACERIRTETDRFVIWRLISLLCKAADQQSLEQLIEVLDWSPGAIDPGGDVNSRDNTIKELRKEIADALERRTGHKFGTDAAKWRLWLMERQATIGRGRE